MARVVANKTEAFLFLINGPISKRPERIKVTLEKPLRKQRRIAQLSSSYGWVQTEIP